MNHTTCAVALLSKSLQFDSMDINGDGVISPHEFYQNCRRKLSANNATFEAALKQHQVAGSAIYPWLITLPEQDVFLDLTELDEQAGVVERLKLEQAKELVRAFQLFDMYDKDNNGVIDRDEYWEVRCVILSSGTARTLLLIHSDIQLEAPETWGRMDQGNV